MIILTQWIAEQTDIVYSKIASIANQENVNLSNIVKVTIYVTNFDNIESLRATLFKHYGSALPASSLVQVDRLFSPDLKIEVEAIIAVE
ncbi:Enamine deaminase RidA (fragment) [Hyella patelloides LEGE 07179]|uniref:Enamine deaminase RidA n=1 Tax=Hyella patelloides LEGE 07179 TaxID=945734 RepID=A0A563VQD1_9CYAN